MLVKHPFAKNTWESAVATSGTRLNMMSHSEPPNRGKRMPASARRYCPVMVQFACLWMPLNLFILYMRRAPLSPREGYNPGEAAVQRMKRQPSKEVTTRATQVVMYVQRVSCQTISNGGVTLKYSPESSASPVGIKARANQEIAAAGSTISDKDRKICMRMLKVSNSQVGHPYWEGVAGRFSSV